MNDHECSAVPQEVPHDESQNRMKSRQTSQMCTNWSKTFSVTNGKAKVFVLYIFLMVLYSN